MANGVRYHPSSRQRLPFERRSLWPQEEEEEVLAGSTYDPLLGSGSPWNYEALGMPRDRGQRERQQLMQGLLRTLESGDDPASHGITMRSLSQEEGDNLRERLGYDPSEYDVQVINREDLGLPPLEDKRLFGESLERTPSLMPPMVTDFKSKISMPSMTPVRNTLAGATSVDDIYQAIFKAEHRLTRKKPWIKTKVRGGSAWGEVQITDGTMETAMNSSAINLTPEEYQYARRYIGIPSKDKAQWLTGPYEKEMYRTIAKKIMDYYLRLSGGDPRGVMTKWYLGLNAGDIKGDPKSSRDLKDVLKRMSKENKRYMEIFLKELGL